MASNSSAPDPKDHLAIMNLRSAYSHALDNGNWDDFGSLFTEDAVVDYYVPDTLHGAEEIKAFGEEEVGYDLSLHMATMPSISVDGDEGTGRWYMTVFYVVDDTAGWVVGEYEDEYRRVDGEWKFSKVENTHFFDTGGFHEAPLELP